MLYSKNSAPLGKQANGNYERYNNPAVDALFDQYPTADDAGQVSIIKQVAAAMIKDVPIIPTTESVDWFQYNTARHRTAGRPRTTRTPSRRRSTSRTSSRCCCTCTRSPRSRTPGAGDEGEHGGAGR